MRCYGQTNGFEWTQEMYETASRDAGRRARQLRKAGYRATVCPMGFQVTGVGIVRMTMVDIRGTSEQIMSLPPVNVERI